jgi:hypothetical protein
MDTPPPKLYVLDENAAHCTAVLEFEKELENNSTAREGTRANTAPPAALLAPEAHDEDEVVELDSKKEQLLTRKTDETPIAGTKLPPLDGNDEAL